MHFLTPLILTCTALSAAAEQKPLWEQAKGYLSKATEYLAAATQVPIDAGASKVAEKQVHQLDWDNWRDVLKHSGEQRPYNPPEAWMVYFTGNKTCHGYCQRMDQAWNVSPFQDLWTA